MPTPIATMTLTRTPTPPPSGELLTNGSIESGASGWSVFGTGTLSANTSVVHGGAQSLLLTANGSTVYVTLARTTAVNSSGWTLLSGTAAVSWSRTLSSANFYVETNSGTGSLYIDDASFQ